MNRELEALETILDYVNLDEYDYETKGVRNAEMILKKSLTPPTADEVCKALSDYFGEEVIVDDRFNNTVFKIKNGNNIAYMTGNNIQITQGLSPRLTKILGQFYEGEIK
jgi:hypothetical protein